MSDFRCELCEREPVFRWTITHGIALCRCLAPYRILHYDEKGDRVDKPPELILKPEYIPHIPAMKQHIKDHGSLRGYTIPGGETIP